MAELIETTTIRPGDHLLVRVNPTTDLTHVTRIGDQLRQRLPDITITVIAAEQLLVHRPNAEATDA